jgi:hypothetical protein
MNFFDESVEVQNLLRDGEAVFEAMTNTHL